jgi:hypothetical protein
MEKENGPIQKIRKWTARILVVAAWGYESHRILFTDAGVKIAESKLVSFVFFTVFWFGLVAGIYYLKRANFSRNEDGEITGDSEITWQ